MNETCGCCDGLEKLTPASTANRPGLDALAYRVGTHATFLETMLARLTGLALEPPPDAEGKTESIYPLEALTTRDPSDPAIALLDAWATVADVLTFYQERIANEGYLPTATERRSILELARLVGYRLRPGISASVYLAFTLENGYETEIPAGTKAQSIPEPGEQMQTFETAEPLEARAAWNELGPRMRRPQFITAGNAGTIDTIYFEGTATNLTPNDSLLLGFGEVAGAQVYRRVQSIDTDAEAELTTVLLQPTTAETPTRAVLARRQELRQITREYLNLEDYEISLETAMAQRVIGRLQTLEATLSRETRPEVITAAIDEALAHLETEHEMATKYQYSNLEPWVGGLVTRLERQRAELAGVAPVSRTRALAVAGNGDRREQFPTIGLGDLVTPLLKAPSVPPANALRLERSVQQAFAPNADLTPRLLTTFRPQLKATLYAAWEHATVTPPSPLTAVEALRVKAVPFGSNAPLKPIYNSQGLIVGNQEWPLATATIGITLSAEESLQNAFFSTEIEAALSLTRDGDSASTLIDLSTQDSFDLDDLGATVTIERSDGEFPSVSAIVFSFDDPDRTITLRVDDTLIVAVDSVVRTVRHEQTVYVSDPANRHTATISLDAAGSTLTIFDETGVGIAAERRQQVFLDATYDTIVPGSWVAIERPGWDGPEVFEVVEAKTVSKAAYQISGKVTQLTLDRPWLTDADRDISLLRNTTIHAGGEELTPAEEPITAPIAGDTIELDDLYNSLESGRWVIVSGERTDIEGTSGVRASELLMLAGVTQDVHKIAIGDGEMMDLPGDTVHTTIRFAEPLSYTYKRETVTVYGNVAKATHGETREEILGSGDGSKTFQTFTLKQSPLTFLSAPTPFGAESTLTVRVNDVRWHAAENLFELEPADRGYVTRTDDDEKTSVIFGDGKHGARLPTGPENTKAVYRSGTGTPGNVAADQISLLATRPLGVKAVINPLPASGGADRESRDQARRNAPLAVMALDRLVSVQDYADFARTFAGIGKAAAVELSDGRRQIVHVTIAGAGDIPIDPTSDLYRNLGIALRDAGDPHLPIQVDVRTLRLLVISAGVHLHPDYIWESVEPAIRAALLDAFSFDRRDLGQDVVLSEAMSVIQHVPGVVYVDVDVFDSVGEAVTPDELAELGDTLERRERIPVGMAEVIPEEKRTATSGRIRPAELAYLSPDVPDTLILVERTS